MVLPCQMAMEDYFFDPISQIVHATELPRCLFLFGPLLDNGVHFQQKLKDLSETFVNMQLEFFGTGKLHPEKSLSLGPAFH